MRRSKWFVLGTSLVAFALVAAACGGNDNNSSAGGSSNSNCTWTIGTMGALSGDYATIGVPIEQGVEVAVKQANDAGDVPCKLTIDKQDSQGDPNQAAPLARQLVQDQNLVAIIGPYFSGETLATGKIFSSAGVPFITPSATNATIQDQGFSTFFRAVANDNVQGPTAAAYIEKVLKPQTVTVIDDQSDYGKSLAETVAGKLKSAGITVQGPLVIDPTETDYSAVVSQVKNTNPDVVYYGGYSAQAGPLDLQLSQAGVKGQFFSDDGTKDSAFGDLAKTAAEGALVTCPCADPTKLPAASDFVAAVKAQFNRNPGTFAADAFDATNLVIAALKQENSGDDVTAIRGDIVSNLKGLNAAQGITKTYTFDDNGEAQIDPLKDIWIYKWSDAAKDFVSLGPASQVIGG
ncbi:MAG: branched-chain amino acid transport system substrate-binding protein [Actinomycetota bacterium]|nr:branched-chain amino acid transport system substrate-binding protein [Actinomycetota bacterium]